MGNIEQGLPFGGDILNCLKHFNKNLVGLLIPKQLSLDVSFSVLPRQIFNLSVRF